MLFEKVIAFSEICFYNKNDNFYSEEHSEFPAVPRSDTVSLSKMYEKNITGGHDGTEEKTKEKSIQIEKESGQAKKKSVQTGKETNQIQEKSDQAKKSAGKA
jgi:hypothetical protein